MKNSESNKRGAIITGPKIVILNDTKTFIGGIQLSLGISSESEFVEAMIFCQEPFAFDVRSRFLFSFHAFTPMSSRAGPQTIEYWVVYHLLGKTGWLTIVVSPGWKFPRVALDFFLKNMKLQSEPGTSKKLANGTQILSSEILLTKFRLPFKFPEIIAVHGDKINLSIYFPSEMSGFFG